MIETIMLCGIGVLAGCLVTMLFFPLVHQRAGRIARQRVVEAVPLAINEIQADKDHLRAQFAMSIRRLEVNIEEMRAKAAGQNGEIGRQSAEISRLQVELDKKTALIFALRAREAVRKSFLRRTLKILLYMFVRANRGKRPKRNEHKPAAAVQAPSLAPIFAASLGQNLGPSLESSLDTGLNTGLGTGLGPSERPSIAGSQT
jgi:hypothetical protein